jgi:hypothetical protein
LRIPDIRADRSISQSGLTADFRCTCALFQKGAFLEGFRIGYSYLAGIKTHIDKSEKYLDQIAVEKQTVEVPQSTMARFANLHQI